MLVSGFKVTMKSHFLLIFAAMLIVGYALYFARNTSLSHSTAEPAAKTPEVSSAPTQSVKPQQVQSQQPKQSDTRKSLNEIRYSKTPLPLPLTKGDKSSRAEEEARLIASVNNLILCYGPSIDALKLSASDERKLRDLLLERIEVGRIAHDVVTKDSDEIRTPGDLQISVELAKKAVDDDIRKAFPPAIADAILYTIQAYPYLASVNGDYSRYFTRAGEPLRGEQVAPLAHVFLDMYGPSGDYAAQRLQSHAGEIDPATGLLPAEAVGMEKAKSVLSLTQVRALADALAARNRRILSENPKP